LNARLRCFCQLGDLDHAAGFLAETRRDLHRHPELSFQEERTAALVAGRLQALGLGA
jgi:metal-dependent amidase/aminoacylase/carboxypeptidase family protein